MAFQLILEGQPIAFRAGQIERVGAGGEGTVFVFRHSGKTFAFKRYHQPSEERFEKLRAAIAARPPNAIHVSNNSTVVQMAWPLGMVQENSKDVGFVMPYVDSQETLDFDFFINPILAKDRRHLETPNLVMRLQIALNLCSVVKSLHDSGHYFIDFKPANVKVYPRTLHVCLIDCDSYSIQYQGRRYPATAYSPQFINPIALVNNVHPSKLGEEQDNWAIAVALFQLFNFDLHPYDGKASESVAATATDDFVKMGLYAYGSAAKALVSPKPQSVHTMWPNELRKLFDKAFTDPQRAPEMSDWIAVLKNILDNKKISRCTQFPNAINHLKFFGFDCMQCAFESRQSNRSVPKINLPKRQKVDVTSITQASKPQPPSKPTSSFFTFDKVFWGIIGLVVIYAVLSDLSTKPKSTAKNDPVIQKSDQTLIQLPSRRREEIFLFAGKSLRVPDTTSQLNLEEFRFCAYESFRLGHFIKGEGRGRISELLLEIQKTQFHDLCFVDQTTRKLPTQSSHDDTVRKELESYTLQTSLRSLLNLR